MKKSKDKKLQDYLYCDYWDSIEYSLDTDNQKIYSFVESIEQLLKDMDFFPPNWIV